MNYGNRNASSDYTLNDLAKGYIGAVTVSIGIVMVSRTFLNPRLAKLGGSTQFIANAVLNYVAASCAGVANLAIMRQKELHEGVELKNEKMDKAYGKSVKAGKKAVGETAFSRFVLPLPVLLLPPLANFMLEKARLLPKSQVANKVLQGVFCTMSLTLALPMSIALFEQKAMMTREQLEE